MGPPLRRRRGRCFYVGARFVAPQFRHECIRAVTASRSLWTLCTRCHCTIRFFRKVVCTLYDVTCFVEWIDFMWVSSGMSWVERVGQLVGGWAYSVHCINLNILRISFPFILCYMLHGLGQAYCAWYVETWHHVFPDMPQNRLQPLPISIFFNIYDGIVM
jgi:hypothetical protein